MKRQLLNVRLGRRDFLKASSAAMVAPALIAANDHDELNAEERSSAAVDRQARSVKAAGAALAHLPGTITSLQDSSFTGVVTVGYYDGSPGGYFADARSLGAGDELLGFTGASIDVIEGEIAGQSGLEDVRSLSLSFDLYPVHEGVLRVWYRQLAPVPHSSATTSFWLPLETEYGLVSWLDVRMRGQQESPARIPIVFGSGGADGVNVLRSGYYAIAVTPADAVAWDSVQLRGNGDGNSLLLTGGDGTLADVPWVLLSVRLTRA